MSVPSLGDLSQSYTMRQRNVNLRQEIGRLTTELATGQVAQVRDVLNGNYSYLTDLTRRLDLLQGYGIATTEAGLYTAAMQGALGLIEDSAGSVPARGVICSPAGC
jgi:flagellar hook-associated protein 3 FlgL